MNINDVIVRMSFGTMGLMVICLFASVCTRVPQNNILAFILLMSAIGIGIIGVVVVKVFQWIAEFGRDNK